MKDKRTDFKVRMNTNRKQKLNQTAALMASIVLVSSPLSIVAKEGLSHVDLFSPNTVSAAEAPAENIETPTLEAVEDEAEESEEVPELSEDQEEPEVIEEDSDEEELPNEEVTEEVGPETSQVTDSEISNEAPIEQEVAEEPATEATLEPAPEPNQEVTEAPAEQVTKKTSEETSEEVEVFEANEPEEELEQPESNSSPVENGSSNKEATVQSKEAENLEVNNEELNESEPLMTTKQASETKKGSNASYTWEEKPDGTLLITTYKGSKKDIKVPEKINGKKVTAISRSAFAKKGLTSLILPEGIESIYPNAFQENKLVNLVIPNTVREVGDYAFASNLLNKLVLGSGVKTIYDYAFYGNKLNYVDFPGSVETIGRGAFADNKIKNVVLRNNLKYIDDHAFFGNQLVKIDLPASLKTISSGSFAQNRLIEVSIRSKDLHFNDDGFHFFMNPGNIVIKGFAKSTSEAMAKKFDFIFVATTFKTKDNSGDEKKPKVVTPGTKTPVKSGDKIQIEGDTKTVFTLPKDLPKGVQMMIVPVNELENTGGLVLAGKVYKIEFEQLGNYKGTFTLEMSYDSKKFAASEVDIYYYDEVNKTWVAQGGKVSKGKITIIIDHFSIYGVFALVTKDPTVPGEPTDPTKPNMPEEASDEVDPTETKVPTKENGEIYSNLGPETKAGFIPGKAMKESYEGESIVFVSTEQVQGEAMDKTSHYVSKSEDASRDVTKSDSKQVSDNQLPDTATSTFDWVIGGLIIMFAGLASLFTRRKKKE